MRMDSDVQDVFARHQAAESAAGGSSNQEQASSTGSSPTKRQKRRDANPDGQKRATDSRSSQDIPQEAEPGSNVQQEQLRGIPPTPRGTAASASHASNENENPNTNQMIAGLLGTLLQPNDQAVVPWNLLSGLLANQQQQQQQEEGQPQRQALQQEPLALMFARNSILQLILQLTSTYLNLPPAPSPASASVTKILELLRVVGQQYLQAQQSTNQLQASLQQVLASSQNPQERQSAERSLLQLVSLQAAVQQTMTAAAAVIQSPAAAAAPPPPSGGGSATQQQPNNNGNHQQMIQVLALLAQQPQQQKSPPPRQQQITPGLTLPAAVQWALTTAHQQHQPQQQQIQPTQSQFLQQQQPRQGQQDLPSQLLMQQFLLSLQQQQRSRNGGH